MNAIGVDVSKYNIGWDPDKALKPIDFVIQRASWSMYKDEKFDELLPGVAKIGVRGAYHYYSSGVSWKAQADLFLRIVADKGFHFYVVDYERAYNSLSARTIAEVSEFVKYVKAKTGKRCLIYFNPDVFKVDIRARGYGTWANMQDVWIAQYPYSIGQIPLATAPALPLGLSSWNIWQYGGGDINFTAGRHAGPDYGGGLAGMDLNYYNGSLDQMKAWLGITEGSVVPTPIPTQESCHLGYLKPRYVKNGPAIITGGNEPKYTHPSIALDASKQAFIKALNYGNEDVWRLFTAPDVGPTKGINSNGNMIYIMAGWSGNVVNVIGRSGDWVKVECIDMSKGLPSVSNVNHEKTPHLVHRMTTVSASGNFIEYPVKGGKQSPWNRLNDPLLSKSSEFYLPAEWVLETATALFGLNVRGGPGRSFQVIGGVTAQSSFSIISISTDTLGHKWGQIGLDRWICIEYFGTPYVNWELA